MVNVKAPAGMQILTFSFLYKTSTFAVVDLGLEGKVCLLHLHCGSLIRLDTWSFLCLLIYLKPKLNRLGFDETLMFS